MMVLRVILFLLKWLGIVLLIALGVVLLLLLLVLLAPVRYRGTIKKEEVPESAVSADGLVSWLNPLIRVRIRFSEKKLRYTVRVLGICLLNSEKPKKKKKEKTKKEKKSSQKQRERSVIVTLDESKHSEVETETLVLQEETDKCSEPVTQEAEGDIPPTAQDTQESVSEDGAVDDAKKKSFSEKIKSIIEKIKALVDKVKAFPEKIKEKVCRVRMQIELLWKKKEEVIVFLQDELHMLTVGKALKTVKGVFVHILPQKRKGHIEFGTGDPESTGKALAVLGIFYAVHGEDFTIVPDFMEKKVIANVFVRGRIRFGTLLRMLLKFVFDKQVRAFYKDLKKLLNVLKQKAE